MKAVAKFLATPCKRHIPSLLLATTGIQSSLSDTTKQSLLQVTARLPGCIVEQVELGIKYISSREIELCRSMFLFSNKINLISNQILTSGSCPVTVYHPMLLFSLVSVTRPSHHNFITITCWRNLS